MQICLNELTLSMLEITPIKAFSDNYLWLFSQSGTETACIVDPGDAKPVLAYIKQAHLSLSAIVLTHHHADHIGGVKELLEHYEVPVYGPESSTIPFVTHPLHEGDNIQVCGTSFSVIEIPGHTMDHIAYYAEDALHEKPVLFCGDTLFAVGCGRIFEGTPAMMYESLQKLAHLKPETLVFCAHEYTLSNLAFAAAVSPDDIPLQKRIKQETAKRERDIPTLPTSIEQELETNPFLRCSKRAMQNRFAGQAESPVEIFTALRQWKDSF